MENSSKNIEDTIKLPACAENGVLKERVPMDLDFFAEGDHENYDFKCNHKEDCEYKEVSNGKPYCVFK